MLEDDEAVMFDLKTYQTNARAVADHSRRRKINACTNNFEFRHRNCHQIIESTRRVAGLNWLIKLRTENSTFLSNNTMQNHTLATLPRRQVQRRTRQRPTKSPSTMNWPVCASSIQLP